MARHTFMFNGGEELTTMGAAWFVSYCYSKLINASHVNWKRVKTTSTRISVFNRTTNFHKYWLQKVLQMDEYNLDKNTIGLSGNQVKEMAHDLLNILP